MATTTIEWTDKARNPVTGCTPYSDGCTNCYAKNQAVRCKGYGQDKYRNGFSVTTHPDTLTEPARYRKPTKIFVCSMADIFHSDVDTDYVKEIFKVMKGLPRHTFQVLTKRSRRLAELNDTLTWPANVWAGVTVESDRYLERIDHLRSTHAAVKFISFEPLLTPMPSLDLSGIDWVIVGGESGHHARPIEPEWVRGIRDQALEQGVSFFFKQWGGKNKKANGSLLDGREWKEFPESQAIAS